MQKASLSSNSMDWCTPQDFFYELNRRFQFTLDAAATESTAKCARYFTPEDDGLSQNWQGHRVFCNPPYGREIGRWVKKAWEEGQKPGTLVVMLIPARTDTNYYHQYIFGHARVEFLRGRLYFTDPDGNPAGRAPFPSALIIFGEE